MSDLDFFALVDGCLCTNVRKLSRVITRIYDGHLEPSGININQLGILLTIQGLQNDNRKAPIGMIGNRLVMEKSTLSRNLSQLEGMGLIEVLPIVGSKREKSAVLTEKGSKTLFGAYEYWELIQDRIRNHFSPQKFTQLIRLLSDLETVLLEEFKLT